MITELFQDIFRILCFCFFLGVVIHRFITKVIPKLVVFYHRYKRDIAEKVKTQERMAKHKKEILVTIQQQHEEGKRLNEKIAIWATKEQLLVHHKKECMQQAQEKLRLYMVEQSRYLALNTARIELMPQIIAQVNHEVENIYTSTVQQKKYTHSVLAALESKLR